MANELINQRITVTIKSDGLPPLADTNGNNLLADYQFCYYSCFCPYYSSVTLVRLRGGVFINSIPAEAISLCIFQVSMEVDMEIQAACVAGKPADANLLYAKISYVTNAVLIKLLGGALAGLGTGKAKRLADLSITRDTSGLSRMIGDLRDANDFLRRFLLSCGKIGRNTSVKPCIGVKGGWREDEPWVSRGWTGTGPLNTQEAQLFVDITKNRPKKYFSGTGTV